MALDYDEVFREGPEGSAEKTEPEQEIAKRLDEAAEQIALAMKTMDAEVRESKRLKKDLDDELKEIRKAQKELAKLLGFFQDHQGAIRASMYATSKYAIEDECTKAVSSIRKVSATAQKEVKDLRSQAEKAVRKAAKKPRLDRILLIVQVALLLLIFIALYKPTAF